MAWLIFGELLTYREIYRKVIPKVIEMEGAATGYQLLSLHACFVCSSYLCQALLFVQMLIRMFSSDRGEENGCISTCLKVGGLIQITVHVPIVHKWIVCMKRTWYPRFKIVCIIKTSYDGDAYKPAQCSPHTLCIEAWIHGAMSTSEGIAEKIPFSTPWAQQMEGQEGLSLPWWYNKSNLITKERIIG